MLDDLLDAFGGKKDRNAKSAGTTSSGGLLGRIGRMLEGGDDSDADRDVERRREERYAREREDDRYRSDDRRRVARVDDEDDDHDDHRDDSRGRRRRDFDVDFGD